MKKILFGMIISAGVTTQAFAVDLQTVYQQALQGDPVILGARATRDANQEQVPQSVATLLPNLSATASSTSIHSKQQSAVTSSFFNSGSTNAHGYELNLSQPLFNLQNIMQLRASRNTAKQAEATYNAALQNLIIRVTAAYLAVLQAEDNLRFTNAQKDAVESQLKQIKAKYDVGLATMTDVYQAQASYDTLSANSIAAKNAIDNSMEGLRQITGQIYTDVSPLKETLPLVTPSPDNASQWIHAAERYNWTLLASRFAEQAARENIRVNYAGHFPTVNAVGSYSNGKNMGFGPSGSNQWQSQLGVQVTLPLFQGGLVSSQTRQAQDQYVAASEQMEATHRQVVFDTQQAFNNVNTAISKIRADRIAITSADSALASTEAGFQAGTKTILDVLTAQQNLYQAQTTLSQDQYSYLNNTLSLKLAAGTLTASDITAINRWLIHA